MTSEAVSVVNHYLLFADKIIPEFGDLLADDVQLVWFDGRTITGKIRVVKFINKMKQESHSFQNILPISDLTFENYIHGMSKRTEENSNTVLSASNKNSLHESKPSTSGEMKNVIDVEQNSDSNVTTLVSEEDYDICEIVKEQCLSDDESESEKIDAEIKDQSYHLDDQLLRNLFEYKIMSQAVQNTNRAELKEEMAPSTSTAITIECGQGDGPVIANSMKYVQAVGVMRYLKQYMSKDSPFAYHWTNLCEQKSWKRKCTLLIAYSPLTNSKQCSRTPKTEESEFPNKIIEIPQRKIPSLDEVLANWYYSIPNTHFGGYLKPLRSFDETRLSEVKAFEARLQLKNYIKTFNWEDFKNKKHDVRPLNVRYMGNKFGVDDSVRGPININFQIHKLVYCKYSKVEE
ncbi:uncharacterized protein LOC109854740 [Pseudomyrmex gracilis]|uniref:uncharacterized protein LOC109854740 n=1 Tax=Pseudomyrmex gracilis TaxID=219809 RepID=UPI000995C9AC|nr:uncharacterized protein LOC109854740 [Pseudomyrmex gracilis]XP_020283871.1 uncharacterized protein LOC109854740 [Pseudomyrmex gracilis]